MIEKQTLKDLGFVLRLALVFLACNILTWFIAFFFIRKMSHSFLAVVIIHPFISVMAFAFFATLIWKYKKIADFIDPEEPKTANS